MEDSIFNQNNPLGAKTRNILDKLGIKSPDITNRIEIKPGLWVVPNKPIKTEEDLIKFLSKWTDKAKINVLNVRKGGLTKVFK